MRTLDRIRNAVRLALVVLSIGLAGAVIGGILLRPPAPVGFPATEGRALLRLVGTGSTPSAAKPVRFQQHAIGVGVRCDGTGTIRVVLHPFAAVESNCGMNDATDGGYVISTIAPSTSSTSWEVRTSPRNRWSLVLTQPVVNGSELVP